MPLKSYDGKFYAMFIAPQFKFILKKKNPTADLVGSFDCLRFSGAHCFKMIIKIFIFICEIQLASGSKGLRCLIMLGTRNRGNCGHVSHDGQTAGRPPPSSGTYNVLLNTVRRRHRVSHSGGRGISISTLQRLLAGFEEAGLCVREMHCKERRGWPAWQLGGN